MPAINFLFLFLHPLPQPLVLLSWVTVTHTAALQQAALAETTTSSTRHLERGCSHATAVGTKAPGAVAGAGARGGPRSLEVPELCCGPQLSASRPFWLRLQGGPDAVRLPLCLLPALGFTLNRAGLGQETNNKTSKQKTPLNSKSLSPEPGLPFWAVLLGFL